VKVIIAKIAKNEFKEAKQYYEIQQEGLGKRFDENIKEAIKRIKKYPEAWQIEVGNVRRCLVHKFPYKILYSIRNKKILILAFAHLHRKPEYWIDRINEISI
jgi:1,2-phenylacetyl-CoA epoxidase catalytic subunit